MELKVMCDCRHFEKTYLVKKIKDKTYCWDCWRAHQIKKGLVDAGCVFPEAEVCPDREPAIVKPSPDKQRNSELDKITVKCYRGHKNCIKHDVGGLLDKVKRVLEKNPATCPEVGCGRTLETISTKWHVISVCPVHGVIFRAVLRTGKENE